MFSSSQVCYWPIVLYIQYYINVDVSLCGESYLICMHVGAQVVSMWFHLLCCRARTIGSSVIPNCNNCYCCCMSPCVQGTMLVLINHMLIATGYLLKIRQLLSCLWMCPVRYSVIWLATSCVDHMISPQMEQLYTAYCMNHPRAVAILTDNS